MKKMLAVALFGSALASGAAYAQSPASTSTPTAVTAPATAGSQWRSSKLIGVDVYNANNDKIGAVQDLILDKTGKVATVVIGVGGFLGMGEHNVGIPFDQVKFTNDKLASNAAAGTTGSPGSTGAGTAMDSKTTTGNASGSAASTGPNRQQVDNSSANQWYPDHAMLNATKDQLKALPAFTY